MIETLAGIDFHLRQRRGVTPMGSDRCIMQGWTSSVKRRLPASASASGRTQKLASSLVAVNAVILAYSRTRTSEKWGGTPHIKVGPNGLNAQRVRWSRGRKQ